MPLLENTDKDFSSTFLLGTCVMKPKSKLKNILLWNATYMTFSCDHIILSLLEFLVLIIDKVLLQCSFIKQKYSSCQLYFSFFLIFFLSILSSYLSKCHILAMVYLHALYNKLLI